MAKKEAGLNLGGILEGLGGLLDVVGKLAEKGEALKKTGEIDIEGLTGKKGKMMYGFTINTLAKGGAQVSSFGNVKRTKEGKTVVEEEREPEADIFDEKDHVLVVAEMPGVEESDIKLDLKEDILDISAARGDRKYHKEILLPSKVKADNMTSTFKNGVLEIKIQK